MKDAGKFAEFAAKLHALIDKNGKYLPDDPDRRDYRQTADIAKVAAAEKAVEKDKIYKHFASNYKKSGLHYIRHLDAIATPAKRRAYCAGIEKALRIPGKGYTSAALRYPTPEAIRQLPSGAAWNFSTDQETEFRNRWYNQEFRAFLRSYIAEPEVQTMLWPHIPSA